MPDLHGSRYKQGCMMKTAEMTSFIPVKVGCDQETGIETPKL
jgi:hypothetical protein